MKVTCMPRQCYSDRFFEIDPSMEPRFGASSAGHKQTDSYVFYSYGK